MIALIFNLPTYPTKTTDYTTGTAIEKTTLQPLLFVLAYNFNWLDYHQHMTMTGWEYIADVKYNASPIYLFMYIPILLVVYVLSCYIAEIIDYWYKYRKIKGFNQY